MYVYIYAYTDTEGLAFLIHRFSQQLSDGSCRVSAEFTVTDCRM